MEHRRVHPKAKVLVFGDIIFFGTVKDIKEGTEQIEFK